MNEGQSIGQKTETSYTPYFARHCGKKMAFLYPVRSLLTYFEAKEGLNSKLRIPTMAENTSLLHKAWKNSQEPISKSIIELSKENFLLNDTGILYIPDEKVAYIQDNPPIKDNKIVMNQSDLIKRLEANDRSVRFACAKDKEKFDIALLGEEGVEKFNENASKYGFDPKQGTSFALAHQHIKEITSFYVFYFKGKDCNIHNRHNIEDGLWGDTYPTLA